MQKKNKKLKRIDSVNIGDLLYYCPVDLEEELHEIGIIYDIVDSNFNGVMTKKFKIFWNRSKIHDVYFESTLERKLKQISCGKNIMILITNNGCD